MRWALLFEALQKLLPWLRDRVLKGVAGDTDALPTLRRVEHDTDRIKEQLDVMVRDQGNLVRDVLHLRATVNRIERYLKDAD